MRALLEQARPHFLQGCDVRDPEAAPVRAHDEVVLARVDDHVVDRDARHVSAELLPGSARVDRGVEPPVGAREEKVRIPPILHDHVHGTHRQAARDADERPAAVDRFEMMATSLTSVV